MKNAVAAIVVVAIVGAAGYWAWNEYSINQLNQELTSAASAQCKRTNNPTFSCERGYGRGCILIQQALIVCKRNELG